MALAHPSPAPRAPRKRSSSRGKKSPSALLGEASPDPNGLLEYSVVYTDRALNHMSVKFQDVMRDISRNLKHVYGAHTVAVVPGSGTFSMEAVARQLGTGKKCLVLRNGYFSYRWSQIFEACAIPSEEVVLRARPVAGEEDSPCPAYAPVPLEELVETIMRERPAVVFAPHVETSSGIILPDAYIRAMAEATHRAGGLLVLDCIASGCVWLDMRELGIDVLISAPQKGWSGPAGVGLVMLSAAAAERVEHGGSTSFAVDLKKWVGIMAAYEGGGHMYHATMPTDAIKTFRDVLLETAAYGYERVKEEQISLGAAVRSALGARGFKSVAAEGFRAPGVVVSYTDDAGIKSGAKFAAQGMQIAAGVPLMLDDFTQSAEFKTFRLGLFGLDKLHRIGRTVRLLEDRLSRL